MLTTIQRLVVIAVSFGAMGIAGCAAPIEADETTAQVASELVVPNTQVGKGDPGAAVFNSTTFVTYIGTDSGINVMRQSTNGTYIKQVLAERSNSGASLAVFNSKLYMSWVGTDNSVNVLTTTNGTDWTSKQVFSGSKHGLPSMTVFNGKLRIIVNEYDNRAAIFDSNSSGTSWTWTETLGDARSNDGFASAVLNGDFLLAWRGTDGNVNVRKYRTSTGWSAITLLGFNANPFLIAVPPTVNQPTPSVAMITGSGSIGVRASVDGINFTLTTYMSGITNDKPIAFRAQWAASGPFVQFDTAFVGTDSNKQLNITSEQAFF